ncbi:MAG: hypothetical protein A2W17_07640 [Planctomycetes bacterium RBG_16_41_13]|nr:MAG: hypothetical protein A2W17_07640 [Planctomycetes bacterium RBG_16_41_13]
MMNKIPELQSAHAILLNVGNYILQLRDNKPTIAASGQWSLFGGMRSKDETPLDAIKREIFEELSAEPAVFKYLWFTDYYADFEKTIIRTWFFVSDFSNVWSRHKLTEGRDVGIFNFEQLAGLVMPPVMRETIEKYHKSAKGKRRKGKIMAKGGFKELKVWQKSKEFAVNIYKITSAGSFENDFSLRDQIRRCLTLKLFL